MAAGVTDYQQGSFQKGMDEFQKDTSTWMWHCLLNTWYLCRASFTYHLHILQRSRGTSSSFWQSLLRALSSSTSGLPCSPSKLYVDSGCYRGGKFSQVNNVEEKIFWLFVEHLSVFLRVFTNFFSVFFLPIFKFLFAPRQKKFHFQKKFNGIFIHGFKKFRQIFLRLNFDPQNYCFFDIKKTRGIWKKVALLQ